MDEYNYEDSTMNSSSNVSLEEGRNLSQKYKTSSVDDQLKVLYEVRCKEVMSLTNAMENLREEFNNHKAQSMKKIMLLEAEKEKTNMSLNNAQSLLGL